MFQIKKKKKNHMKPNQSTHNQRGVSALEFTILAPLLFVLIYGMIEFSICFYDKAVITNASREGARAGIDDPSPNPRMTESEIKQVVLNYAQNHLITFGDHTFDLNDITVVGAGGAFGNDLKVTVQYPYKFLVLPNFDFGWVDLSDTIYIRAMTVMTMM